MVSYLLTYMRGRILTSDVVVLGPRLQSLDILEIGRNRWYEAKSQGDVRAVIGIKKGERYLPEETKKRRRVEGEEDESSAPSP